MGFVKAWQIHKNKKVEFNAWKDGKREKWRAEGVSEQAIEQSLRVHKIMPFWKLCYKLYKNDGTR